MCAGILRLAVGHDGPSPRCCGRDAGGDCAGSAARYGLYIIHASLSISLTDPSDSKIIFLERRNCKFAKVPMIIHLGPRFPVQLPSSVKTILIVRFTTSSSYLLLAAKVIALIGTESPESYLEHRYNC
jgi:hypothetical protein